MLTLRYITLIFEQRRGVLVSLRKLQGGQGEEIDQVKL
tara:strand:- start:721 stop:834 length:114 start_codon:yes stop_codon:yes gene_type:complete